MQVSWEIKDKLLVTVRHSHQWGVMLRLRGSMTGIAEDTIVIVLGVYRGLLGNRVAGTIRVSAVLETRCVICVDNLDILGHSALLILRVIVLLEGQLHIISFTLDQLRVRGACRQGVLHLRAKPLLQVREVNLVDLLLRLESLF